MARTKRSMRCVGVALMALMMVFAMTVGSFAATDSQEATHFSVTIYEVEGDTVTENLSMAQNAVAGDAVYDAENNTLTIPLQEYERDYGIMTGYGCMTGIDFLSGAIGSGSAEYGASEIVISNFTPADGTADGSYRVTFDVTVKVLGIEMDIPAMQGVEAQLVLS